MSGFELKAIPTTYRGIEFRSRMEAQCAVLFDKLGWEFEYEKHSIILPSGTTFMPDFWFDYGGLLVECRGYENDRGDRQIRETGALFQQEPHFIELSETDQAARFAVIGPEECYTYDKGGKMQGFVVALSARTGRWELNHNFQDHTVAAYALSVSAGKLLLNREPLDEAVYFHELCAGAVEPRREFQRYIAETVKRMMAGGDRA